MDDRQHRGVTLNGYLRRSYAGERLQVGKVRQQASDEDLEHTKIFSQWSKPGQFQLYSQQQTSVDFVSPLRIRSESQSKEQLPASPEKDD
ncbi:MAG: hypothetical protein ACKVHE_22005 [Planctomycetales bacterium]|jgi:hypothetical protein